MKNLKRGIFFLAIVSIIFISYMPKAFAGNYWGEFCWIAEKTEGTYGEEWEGPFLVRLGFTHMGDDYFTIQGHVNVDENPLIISGSAIIIKSEIFMNLQWTSQSMLSPWRDTSKAQMNLSLSNLNGNFWAIGHDFNTETRAFGMSYGSGTMTSATCP